MKRGGSFACAVLILGLWLPWAHLSIGAVGDAGESVNGVDIGSDVLSLPAGWIAAAAGVLGLYGLARTARGLTAVAGSSALLVTAYALLAIPSQDSTAGQGGSDLVNDKVSLDWGTFAVGGAALILLASALLVPVEPLPEEDAMTEEPDEEPPD
jgi:hypothetical protein